jgi:heme exporter protein C
VFLSKYASPQNFFTLAGKLEPWFWVAAVILSAIGLYIGLGLAPTDATQGEVYRVIFIHVPAAWMSMWLYLIMAFYAVLLFVFNTKVSGMMIRAIAPTGAWMTLIALVTGALWGRPTWGTYWAWDARMTTELLLLFLYLGVIALANAIDDPKRGDRAAAILSLVGSINVPIIYYSVKWWNTLHQGASVSLTSSPKMAKLMLNGMLIMGIAFWMYAIAVALNRARSIVLERERDRRWLAGRVATGLPREER